MRSRTSTSSGRAPEFRLAALLLALCAGCVTVPPENLSVDRFDYGNELAESWKRQTLVNVVRLRYSDAPVFMDVTSIISSRSRAAKINASGELVETPDPSFIDLGAEGAWSNTPTITYQPIIGDKFAKSLLRPIPPASVFQMLEAGWPPKLVLNLTVNSMNGVNNASFIGQKRAPEFEELLELLTGLRSSGALGVRVEEKAKGDAVIMIFRADTDEDQKRDLRRVGEILKLEPGVNELFVTYGSASINPREIAMTTRSMFEIMLAMGNGIELPDSHVLSGRARPVPPDTNTLVRIQSGDAAPADAYAAVLYRRRWYWIDDRDSNSKSVFTFLMILFSLAETGQAASGPVVTVPSR